MWSAAGQNLTRLQVTPIEGAIPTVTIGASRSATVASSTPVPPATRAVAQAPRPAVPLLKTVESTTYGSEGPPTAPKLWVFIDPLCSFSVRAMDQLRPYVASGGLSR